jgi:hypothetical protein
MDSIPWQHALKVIAAGTVALLVSFVIIAVMYSV